MSGKDELLCNLGNKFVTTDAIKAVVPTPNGRCKTAVREKKWFLSPETDIKVLYSLIVQIAIYVLCSYCSTINNE